MNGFDGVEALACHVDRSRGTLYNALKQPDLHKPTIAALEKALPIRRVRSEAPTPKPRRRKLEVAA